MLNGVIIFLLLCFVFVFVVDFKECIEVVFIVIMCLLLVFVVKIVLIMFCGILVNFVCILCFWILLMCIGWNVFVLMCKVIKVKFMFFFFNVVSIVLLKCSFVVGVVIVFGFWL